MLRLALAMTPAVTVSTAITLGWGYVLTGPHFASLSSSMPWLFVRSIARLLVLSVVAAGVWHQGRSLLWARYIWAMARW